jgi:hypothetical protein
LEVEVRYSGDRGRLRDVNNIEVERNTSKKVLSKYFKREVVASAEEMTAKKDSAKVARSLGVASSCMFLVGILVNSLCYLVT